jgi:4-hydroxy-2-oxoglutarate aldolase
MKLQGIFLPTATPFDHDGELYRAKLRHNVESWNRTSLAGYVVCGSTGESAALSSDEKIRLWEWVAEYAAPDKLLIAGAGVGGVRETVWLAGKAAESGYKAVLIETPRSAWSAEEQRLYFRTVADQLKLPVIVCGQPEASVIELSRHPNIIAAVADGLFGMKPGLDMLAGTETAVWTCLSAGATGAVLSFANAAPYSTITIWETHRTREAEAGLDWQNRIRHAAQLVTGKYGIPGLKYAMDLNGYYGGPCRLPLVPLYSAAKKEIEEAFRDLRG